MLSVWSLFHLNVPEPSELTWSPDCGSVVTHCQKSSSLETTVGFSKNKSWPTQIIYILSTLHRHTIGTMQLILNNSHIAKDIFNYDAILCEKKHFIILHSSICIESVSSQTELVHAYHITVHPITLDTTWFLKWSDYVHFLISMLLLRPALIRAECPNRVGGGEPEAGKNRVSEFRWEVAGTPQVTPLGKVGRNASGNAAREGVSDDSGRRA